MRRAFTLVELLVVVGIIALLIAILLPVMSKARGAANAAACKSNMRQLTLAMLTYSADNRNGFPAPAVNNPSADDWVYWQPGMDISLSALYRYAGRGAFAKLLMCPSDTTAHPPVVFPNNAWILPAYSFSYTVNWMICEPRQYGGPNNISPLFYAVYWGDNRIIPNLKITQVRRPYDVVLFVDESAQTVDDGCWDVQSITTINGTRNIPSARHSKRTDNVTNPAWGTCNVSFVDGHVDALPRAAIMSPAHYDPQKWGVAWDAYLYP